MGCISSNDINHPKKYKSNKEHPKQVETTLYKSKLGNSQIRPKQQLPPMAQQPYAENKFPKIKKTTSQQFKYLYEITQTLKQATRLQGPKLVTNRINGSVNVLRVYSAQRVKEIRLKEYQKILKFQVYQDEQENYLIIDQYCAGTSIAESNSFQGQNNSQADNNDLGSKKAIHDIIVQVYNTIIEFHANKTYLGNLNMFAFKRVSEYDDLIRLTQFNLQEQPHNEHESIGHAHSNSFQSDWQFFGYLIQFYLFQNKSPLFIPHKMGYIPISYDNPSSNNQNCLLIASLLKGKQCSRNEILGLDLKNIKVRSPNVMYGYMFCRDVSRLIRARKRRCKHKSSYYSEQVLNQTSLNSNQNVMSNNESLNRIVFFRLKGIYNSSSDISAHLSEQNMHRLQTQRILSGIQGYIENLKPQCEEHFINYSSQGQSLSKRLKQVFFITQKRKKFDEFKELIPHIK